MEPTSTSRPPPFPGQGSTDPRFEAAWRIDRPYLIGMASKMLGDPAAAEDVVQEAFGRLMGVELEEIDDVRGWLAVVVRRLCLNRIKSAYSRREAVSGADPAEGAGLPLPGAGPDPADRVSLDDQVRLALAVIIDKLTPAERTAFLLHDVFGFSFAAIAEIVGRTPTACRQLASRARRAVRDEGPSAGSEAGAVGRGGDHNGRNDHDGSIVAERFIAACAGGDIAEFVAVLDPDVEGGAKLVGGGRLGHAEGADVVAADTIRRFGPGTGSVLVPVPVEDIPAIVVLVHGRLRAVIKLDSIVDGLIRHIDAYVLPLD